MKKIGIKPTTPKVTFLCNKFIAFGLLCYSSFPILFHYIYKYIYTKQSDGEVSVMLGLWGMRSIPLLPSVPDPLWLGGEVLDRALSMG